MNKIIFLETCAVCQLWIYGDSITTGICTATKIRTNYLDSCESYSNLLQKDLNTENPANKDNKKN